mgnify:CR=1 FL=1|tara:strand:- start:152 stop:1066 length:915 start_codon:yes stop_codon:yes gene_type:complete
MKKYKIFIYDDAKPHAHDQDPVYENTVPLSNIGIKKHFDVTTCPDNADIFYMGQFSEGQIPKFNQYKFLQKYPNKHVCDIEGDWLNKDLAPEDIKKSIFTINGLKDAYKPHLDRMFIRPTFSKNLMNLLKKKTTNDVNYNKKFSFIGLNDPFNIRLSLKSVLEKRFPNHTNITLNNRWLGSSNDKTHHRIFNETILSGTFSLCPRGSGVDSVRFLESCFHGRIPIVVSDNVCFGYEFPKKFYFQYDFKQNHEIFFDSIMNMTNDEIKEYSNNAREFFNTYVRNYFYDPTQMFLDWFKRYEKNTR